MKTGLKIGIGFGVLALAGGLVYWFGFRKKPEQTNLGSSPSDEVKTQGTSQTSTQNQATQTNTQPNPQDEANKVISNLKIQSFDALANRTDFLKINATDSIERKTTKLLLYNVGMGLNSPSDRIWFDTIKRVMPAKFKSDLILFIVSTPNDKFNSAQIQMKNV